MKFGLLWHFRNPAQWRRPWGDLYSDSLEEISFAEELGYDSAWVSEHHFCDDGYLPSLLPALAAVATSTNRIRIGSYVLLMPLHHPLLIAEGAAVVDNLSRGRLEMAIGVGYRKYEFEILGVPHNRRGELQGEGVEVLLKAWRDEPFAWEGRHYKFPEVSVTPKPLQRPSPPIYLGGVSARVLRRVARLPVAGVAGIPSRRDLPRFQEELKKYGKDPSDVGYLPLVYLWVHRDTKRAKEIAVPYAKWVLGKYAQWHKEAGVERFSGRPEDACIIGNPDECITGLRDFFENCPIPVNRLILSPPLLGLDHEASLEMIETFAQEVAPHFQHEHAG